jgi:hypothetical protein
MKKLVQLRCSIVILYALFGCSGAADDGGTRRSRGTAARASLALP